MYIIDVRELCAIEHIALSPALLLVEVVLLIGHTHIRLQGNIALRTCKELELQSGMCFKCQSFLFHQLGLLHTHTHQGGDVYEAGGVIASDVGGETEQMFQTGTKGGIYLCLVFLIAPACTQVQAQGVEAVQLLAQGKMGAGERCKLIVGRGGGYLLQPATKLHKQVVVPAIGEVLAIGSPATVEHIVHGIKLPLFTGTVLAMRCPALGDGLIVERVDGCFLRHLCSGRHTCHAAYHECRPHPFACAMYHCRKSHSLLFCF